MKDAGYNVEGYNVDEGFKNFDPAAKGNKMVSFAKLVGQALKFFGINETYL